MAVSGKEADMFADIKSDMTDIFSETGFENIFSVPSIKKISSNLTPSERNNKRSYILENAK